MSKRKSLIPSREMRRYYAEQMVVRLKNELPDVILSNYVKDINVFPRWGYDSADPKGIVVRVKNKNGNVIKFKEPLYGFPSELLVAKIGILL